MTTPLPDPAAPRDAVGELHAAVRKWTGHIPQNLPYVDLMFAFGHATLGDRPRAVALVESARKVMQIPIPAVPARVGEKEMAAIVSPIVSNFLFKAFAYRVDQALAGQPHTGPLSRELLDQLEEIAEQGRNRPTHNPFKLAEYVITRLRGYSLIVEPHERPNIYNQWSSDALNRQLTDLAAIRDPRELATRIRTLLRDGVPGKPPWEVQLRVLHEALPLAPRIGENFTVGLLEMVPGVLTDEAVNGSATEQTDVPFRQKELLACALFVAGHYERRDLVEKLVDVFVELVHGKPEGRRFKLINYVASQCLLTLKKLGLRDEIDRLLTLLQAEVPGGAPTAEMRPKHARDLESWAARLQTLLNLAAGYLMFGLNDRAAPILQAARQELLTPHTIRLQPKEYIDLARAYIQALGHGPAKDGFARLIEMFREMDPRAITNTWTTAAYYSRFHLNLVEDAVFAVCGLGSESPHVVSA